LNQNKSFSGNGHNQEANIVKPILSSAENKIELNFLPNVEISSLDQAAKLQQLSNQSQGSS